MNCKHWTDCGVIGGGCCGIKKYGDRPSFGVCRYCLSQGNMKKAKKRQSGWWKRLFRPRFVRWTGPKQTCCGGVVRGTTPIFRWAFAEWYGWPKVLRLKEHKYVGCGCLVRLKDWWMETYAH